MERTIRIGDREVPMRATAATPRHYRNRLGRDLLEDLTELGTFSSFTVAENLAYIMAMQAGAEVPETVEAWLDGFDDPFAVRNALDDILGLWTGNTATLETGKKK